MSDSNSQNDETTPVIIPSRTLGYPLRSTMIRQGGDPTPPALLMHLEAEMEPGEQLLWTGIPDLRRSPDPATLTAHVLGATLVAAGLGFFFVLSTSGILSVVMGVPIVLLGLCVSGARLTIDRKNVHTIYALTNRRALILTAGQKLSVQSFHPEDVGAVLRTEFPDGTGHLTFGGRDISAVERQSGVRTDGFYGIPGVRAVEKLARTVLKDQPRLDVGAEA